ncbi:hypothetical protein CEXT_696321 [Caerostris extrusa]|uniref:Uncharacterized protein n=1 Tax=Caerostris extrusa TaxID=172846 RepID=A0AAV4YEF9_CAEEX|nr:hypothetical protein CEXT_696321 [Caerostris extrusa]
MTHSRMILATTLRAPHQTRSLFTLSTEKNRRFLADIRQNKRGGRTTDWRQSRPSSPGAPWSINRAEKNGFLLRHHSGFGAHCTSAMRDENGAESIPRELHSAQQLVPE